MSDARMSARGRDRTTEPTPEQRAQWHAECKRRMAQIDALGPVHRALVHEYGWEPVKMLMDLGAKRAAHIEHIIRAIQGRDKEDLISHRHKQKSTPHD
jgi:hypothetical protein